MRTGHVSPSLTAGTIWRVKWRGWRSVMLAALSLAALPTEGVAIAQGPKLNASPLVFPASGSNAMQARTFDIHVVSATAFRSIGVPVGFVASPDFVYAGQSGCIVDGTTINAAGTICTVSVRFRPVGAGLRTGSVIVTDGAGIATAFGVSGTGYFAQVAITPGAAKVVTGLGPTLAAYSGDGAVAVLAGVNAPQGIATDSFGNVFFVDTGNNVLRMLDAFGNITTVAGGGATAGAAGDGGAATSAALVNPTWLAVDSAGSLYISESGSNVIRRVAMSGDGTISTYAGSYAAGSSNGSSAITATLSNPQGIAMDPAGNLFIADAGNNLIRRVDASTGQIATVAGSGLQGFNASPTTALLAQFNAPAGLALDGLGNLYIADSGNHAVRELSAGKVSVIAGTGIGGKAGDGGLAMAATLTEPSGLAISPAGDVYVVDRGAGVVRKIEAATANIETAIGSAKDAGDYTGGLSVATTTRMKLPTGLGFDASGALLLADTGNNVVRRISGAPGDMAFAAQAVGNTSPASTVEVANVGNAPLSVASVSGVSNTASNFVLNNVSCGTSPVAAGAHCVLTIAFSPQTTGFITGEVDVVDNAGLNPNFTYKHPILLTGGVPPPLTISPGTLSVGVASKAYSATITVAGGYGQVAVQTSGSLPSGIAASVSGTIVTLSGTPTTVGSSTFYAYAADALGQTVAQPYTLTIAPQVVTLAVSETVHVTDAAVETPGLVLSVSERITVSDSLKTLPGLLLNIAERITVTDRAVSLPQLNLQVAETITVADNARTLSSLSLSVIEMITVTDVLGAFPSLQLKVSEAIRVSDSVSPLLGLSLSIAEGVTVTDTVQLSMVAVSQTITALNIANHRYGDAAFLVSATASSGLPVAVAVQGPATLLNGSLDLTGAGSVTVTFTQTGNSGFTAAPPITRTFSVAPALLLIAADNASRSFEMTNPAFTLTATGLVHGDSLAALGGVPALGTSAVLNSPAGSYPITIAQGTLSSSKYLFTLLPGTLTVLGRVAQSITFSPIPNVPVTVGTLTFTAHSTSGLTITYTVSGPGTINGNKLMLSGPGTVTVSASQPGNATFDPAIPISRSFVVAP